MQTTHTHKKVYSSNLFVMYINGLALSIEIHRNTVACQFVVVLPQRPAWPPQHHRHNRHSDSSPSGSNYWCILKECWSFLRASSHSLRVLQLAQGGRPPTCSTLRPAGELDGDNERIDFHLYKKKFFKNIRSHCSVFCFTPKFRGSVQQVKAISSRPPHEADRAVNPSWGVGEGIQCFRCAYLQPGGSQSP